MDSLRDLHDFVKQARRISRNCGRSGQADEKGRISLPYSMGRYAAQTRILTKGSSNAAKTRIGKKVKQFLLEWNNQKIRVLPQKTESFWHVMEVRAISSRDKSSRAWNTGIGVISCGCPRESVMAESEFQALQMGYPVVDTDSRQISCKYFADLLQHREIKNYALVGDNFYFYVWRWCIGDHGVPYLL